MNTGDILGTLDLLALDSACLEEFGDESGVIMDAKRAVAVEHWLESRVGQHGYPVDRHQTRRAPVEAKVGPSSGTADFTDLVAAARDRDLNVVLTSITNTTFAYIGYTAPYSGLWMGVLDSVNTASLTVAAYTYWNGGGWASYNSLADATYASNSIAMSGGGRVQWRIPDNWAPRPVGGGSAWLYWTRVGLSNSPGPLTGQASQVLPIRRSKFTVPAALHALGLAYRDAAVRTRGDWMEKAKMFLDRADAELTLIMPLARDEFDMDDDGAVGPGNEAASITAAGGFEWLRG